MSKIAKYAVAAVMGAVVVTGFWFLGRYLGGRAFAAMQHIPPETVNVDTLSNYWHDYSHIKKVRAALQLGYVFSIAVPVVPVVLAIAALLSGSKRELHGSARFAKTAEIQKAGLLGDGENEKWPGILVGKYKGKFLTFFGQQFVSLAAPTRSGKGVGLVIPNLLTYPHSVVATDIKLENWHLTAGYRAAHGQECYLFAPGHPEFLSHRWNMLSYVRRAYEFRVGDIQNIGTMWWPTGGKDAFFNDNARSLFLGLVLYMLETPDEPVTMPNLVRLVTPADGSGLHEWIEATILKRENPENGLPRLSPECVESLRTYATQTDKTRSNILSTLMAPLDIFRDPRLAAATSGDDFDFRDLRRRKISLYIGMTPEDLVRYEVLMNVFFSQLMNENTRVLPEHDPSLKYQCLLLLDEVAALGRIAILAKAIGYQAAYNMRAVLIYQNNGQLIGDEGRGYGVQGTKTLLTNCALKIMYQPKEEADAKEYSETLGYQTVKSRSISRTTGKPGTGHSDSEQKRALMLPQEVKEIGFKKLLISMENCKPIFADKIIYHEDPELKERLGFPVPAVPPLEIKRAMHRTRVMRQEEIEQTDADDILNKAAILQAIGDAIGFDFASFVPDEAAEEEMAKAA
ncbi:type IV secretory system conjugative DNA transfer family protein [Massilia putida]|uniref:type IV secretory system conjugative DNA transfer family protein n=1 Tax=Massilia putida TaxID=1141883 RepID=UPI0009511E2E|nr:type IV secretory system conjugative DNA transfer family protein [Massilia putida]